MFDAHDLKSYDIMHLSSEYVTILVNELTFCVGELACWRGNHEPEEQEQQEEHCGGIYRATFTILSG